MACEGFHGYEKTPFDVKDVRENALVLISSILKLLQLIHRKSSHLRDLLERQLSGEHLTRNSQLHIMLTLLDALLPAL